MLPPDTYSVSQLGQELQLILSETLTGLWVAGEVRRPTKSRAGHLYFELVEKGRGDSVKGSIQAVLFRTEHQRVQRQLRRAGIELVEGQLIRCLGSVDFYPPGGRLQLIARDVDPVFSLGDMAQRRQEALRLLKEQGLLRLNGSLALPELPLRIGLLTSVGSAADQDFRSTLAASPFAFEIVPIDVAVQGARAERELVRGLERAQVALGSSESALDTSVVVMVRGGGSRSDLAAFDSLAVASAVAQCGLPVLTGLGHETDESVADLVAHTSFKTPTAVAEFLDRTLHQQERQLEGLAADLAAAAFEQLHGARRSLSTAELRVQVTSGGLKRHSARIERLAQRLEWLSRARTRDVKGRLANLEKRLVRTAARPLIDARAAADSVARSLDGASRRALRSARRRVHEQDRLVQSLSLQRTLDRGFSVTRTAAGTLVRRQDQVTKGTELKTELSSGSIDSTVT